MNVLKSYMKHDNSVSQIQLAMDYWYPRECDGDDTTKSDGDLQCLTELICVRNANEMETTRVNARTANVGEYIATRIFDIALKDLTIHPGDDDRYRSGPLVGRSVTIKMYGKREGLLDIHLAYVPDLLVTSLS